jgi:uncharacterized protein YbjT (DUF2867 family)
MFVVAGASGRTGKVVAETLLSQGKPVRVLLRDATKGKAWKARGADVALAALDDTRALTGALEGASGFYTLLPEDVAVTEFDALRRRTAEAVAFAVRRSGVPHVVLLSALAAGAGAGSGLGEQLRHAEDALREAAARVTVLRACAFQENVCNVLAAARTQGVFPSFFAEDAAAPMVATRDVARLAAHALVEPPSRSEIVDVIGPAYSARQQAVALGSALGKPLQVVVVPPAAHADTLSSVGLPRQMAEAVARMFAAAAAGRIRPQGDRVVLGETRLEDILPALIGAAS